MRSKTREDGTTRTASIRWRDLMVGENPWNGTKKLGDQSELSVLRVSTLKCSTRVKVEIQPSSSASADTTTGGHLISRILV